MKHTKIMFYVCLVAILFFNFAFAEQVERSGSTVKVKKIEQAKVIPSSTSPSEKSATIEGEKVSPQEVSSLPKSANFILVTDVLDGFGGNKSDGGCKLSFFAGGQSSPIGAGSSTNFNLYAGFVYPAVVKCGDVNADGVIDVGDIVYLLNYLFKSGSAPKPLQAGDANCDGIIDVGDVVYLLNYLFKGGNEPIC